MRSHRPKSRVFALLILLSAARLGWGERMAAGGVALNEGEVVSVDNVTCGLIEGEWRPGQLNKRGLFFTHSRWAELLTTKAVTLNRTRWRTSFQDALLTRYIVESRKFKRLATRQRATCRVLGNQVTPTSGTVVVTATLPLVNTTLPISTNTATSTVPQTPTATSTFTVPPTYTPYPTFTSTAIFTATSTATSTATATSTPTATNTPTITPTPIAYMPYVHGDGQFDSDNGLDNYLTGSWPTATPTP